MEVVVCAAVTCAWWMSSMSVLLPFVFLLKYSKSFRNRWFSWVFIKFSKPVFEPKLLPLRKQTFALLKSHLEERDINIPLYVLEIGIGSGANLQFYPENSHLTAVDMNASFEPYFNQNKKKYPQVVYDKTVICMAESMPEIKDSSMDIVVSTYVLCSVENVDSVLKEIRRVLKPGGKFVYLEHVSYPVTEWSLTVQRLAAPLWRLYFDGCCLNRNIADQIKNTGFNQVSCQNIYPPSLLLFIRPQIMGIATK